VPINFGLTAYLKCFPAAPTSPLPLSRPRAGPAGWAMSRRRCRRGAPVWTTPSGLNVDAFRGPSRGSSFLGTRLLTRLPLLFTFACLSPVPCVALNPPVDPCALDIPTELIRGGYNNVSALYMPLDPTSRVRTMLAGKTVRFVAHFDAGRVEHSTYTDVDGCVDCPWPDIFICAPHLPNRQCASEGGVIGRDVDVVTAIAARGNFHVEWAVSRDLSATFSEKYAPLAVNFTADVRFDISGNWWTDTEERRKLGMVVGHHHTDASRVLVTRVGVVETSLDLDLLIRPYTTPVWLSFWATLVLYRYVLGLSQIPRLCSHTRLTLCLIYRSAFMLTTERRGWQLDTRLGNTKVQRFISGCVYEAWLGFERFNGGDPNPPSGPSDPRTNMGRAMSSLWGTFVVLFIAMYTAKLSSILVAQDADVSSSGKIQSMADVRDFGGGRILTFTGEPMRQRIINAHPYLRITEVGALSGMTSVKVGISHPPHSASLIAHTRTRRDYYLCPDCLLIHITRD
jgi:hypothetical protein